MLDFIVWIWKGRRPCKHTYVEVDTIKSTTELRGIAALTYIQRCSLCGKMYHYQVRLDD